MATRNTIDCGAGRPQVPKARRQNAARTAFVRLSKLVGVVVLAIFVPHGVLQGSPEPVIETSLPTVALQAVGEPEALLAVHVLPVVDIAPLPFGELEGPADLHSQPGLGAASMCPFDVRAVVLAEQPTEHFAVLVAGDDSHVVRAGGVMRVESSVWSVLKIERERVTLRRGEVTLICKLSVL